MSVVSAGRSARARPNVGGSPMMLPHASLHPTDWHGDGPSSHGHAGFALPAQSGMAAIDGLPTPANAGAKPRASAIRIASMRRSWLIRFFRPWPTMPIGRGSRQRSADQFLGNGDLGSSLRHLHHSSTAPSSPHVQPRPSRPHPTRSPPRPALLLQRARQFPALLLDADAGEHGIDDQAGALEQLGAGAPSAGDGEGRGVGAWSQGELGDLGSIADQREGG